MAENEGERRERIGREEQRDREERQLGRQKEIYLEQQKQKETDTTEGCRVFVVLILLVATTVVITIALIKLIT